MRIMDWSSDVCASDLGANRGIGLEFVKSFAADGWRVHGCARNVDKEREARAGAGHVTLHRLDVTNGLKVASLARELADEAIDLLINNAGGYGPRTGFGENDYNESADIAQDNDRAPLRMIERVFGRDERAERQYES